MSQQNPEFKGFGKDAMPFLKALAFHQTREWFQENKDLYESEVREPMMDLVDVLSTRFEKSGIPLRGSRKTSLFRINRDVRFSKEKHPYKTNISAVLSRNGTKKDIGGIYLHFEPTGSFLASGMWYPPAPELKAMREQIVARSKDFLKITEDLEKAGQPLAWDEKVSRTPLGFRDVTDENILYWLRHKGFVSRKAIDNADIHSDALIGQVEEFTRNALPLMQFIWRAVDPLREESGNA